MIKRYRTGFVTLDQGQGFISLKCRAPFVSTENSRFPCFELLCYRMLGPTLCRLAIVLRDAYLFKQRMNTE
jgi:hypothetical protein